MGPGIIMKSSVIFLIAYEFPEMEGLIFPNCRIKINIAVEKG
jgi:hypothetical protein